MLNGVEETAVETLNGVNKIKDLMGVYKKEIKENFTFYSHDLINLLFKHSYTKIAFLERGLKIHKNTARVYLNQLVEANLLRKKKIGKTNYYINEPLIQI